MSTHDAHLGSDGRVVVVGAGLIGLSAAWRLAQRGRAVTIVDPAPAHAASRAAAGMLAPVSEVGYGEERMLGFARESLARYPGFVAELEAATGIDVRLRDDGTLVVAADTGDRNVLADLHAFQSELGLTATTLTSREARRLEPGLSPGIRSGLLVADDHSVDNRQLAAALLIAIEQAGVEVVNCSVGRLDVADGRCAGVTLADGRTLTAPATVLAAGPWSSGVPGLPPHTLPDARPVKGQILRLNGPADLLPRRSIRGLVAGREIYLVPRHCGELVVGATVEERGFDTTVTAGAVHELLHDARTVLPAVDELALVETFAAIRPGSPDNAPIVGRTAVAGLVLATGHYRNGVLLTPLTADLVAECIEPRAAGDSGDSAWLGIVSPARFARQPALA